MSGSASGEPAVDADQNNLDAIADRLYQLRPEAFAAARDEETRKARASGQKVLARELAELHRPTQSAWLINLLWRDQRDTIEGLLQLADDLRQAQAQASGPDLQRLMEGRRELETALIRRAGKLAEEAGARITPTIEREVQGTLAAALADGDVADQLRIGRLVRPASYAGFGALPMAGPPTEASSEAVGAAKPRRSARAQATNRAQGPQAQEEPENERRGQEERDAQAAAARALAEVQEQEAQRKRQQRELAERRAGDARVALDVAAKALTSREQACEALSARLQLARDLADELRRNLADLEVRITDIERAAGEADRLRSEAEQEHEAAKQELERAEQDLKPKI